MKSDRGLVVERTGRRVTALSRSGNLVTFRSDRDDLMVGMEVSLPVLASLFTWRRLAPALALSLVIVLISSIGYQQYLYAQPVVAYVTLDSAGSIELEINQAGLVKSATGIDAAGQEALSSVDYRNKPAQEVVAALVKAQDPEKKAEVVVAVVPVTAAPGTSSKDTEKAEKAMQKLEKKVTDGASSSGHNTTSLRLGPEVRESAQQLGISAGRAALWALSLQASPHEEGPKQEGEPEADPGKGTSGQGNTQVPAQGGDGPGQQSGQGSTPPGQQKKESILDTIKGALPQVDPEDLSGLNEHKDAKAREKFLKDLTKSWVDRVVEEMRKDDKGDGKGDGTGSNSTPPGQSKKNDGEGNDKGKGGSDKGGSSEGGKGKGASSQPDTSKPSTPTQVTSETKDNDHHQDQGGSSKRSGFSQVLNGILSRLPWRRK